MYTKCLKVEKVFCMKDHSYNDKSVLYEDNSLNYITVLLMDLHMSYFAVCHWDISVLLRPGSCSDF